ncbi:MAG: hypothetical protein sL5_09700 [Candidatus Mesenet longicola]|uniref:Uncharacterized protein n=1 Tax=Candidatus Mesenet longicola TaxID=1892558 RepID=A0A8J3HVD3_9RICK|nr:MAG: hypothetical protein sGL2_10520 [Candidatus Mesenet longicola]GHM59977.1 MAG: hypothetical protein sL5_09700 [Candidatus Mesenet longicola]
MSGWRKFGVALYCSTTLAATVVVGFALFIGATPSKINLFDKNRDVRKWVFIAAAVSLAYITLSALTMFCILTTAKKSDLKCVGVNTDSIIDNSQQKNKIADDSSPLLRSNSSIKPTSSQQLDDKSVIQDTKKAINHVNEVNISNSPIDCFRSNYFDYRPLPQSQIDAPSSELVDVSCVKSKKKINDNSDWKETMKVPEHIYVGM